MKHRLAEADFLKLLDWLQQRTGLTFRTEQHANTRVIVDRVIEKLQVTQPAEVPIALLQRPELLAALVNALTVGETYFFRESRHFDLLREQVIPDIHQRLGIQHPVRIWSAGCASGEEAYSIAMVVDQMNLHPRPLLLATDLSEAALCRADRASYRSWSLRGEAAETAHHYLQAEASEYRLNDRIKSMVTLQQHNLAADDYPSNQNGIREMDVIFCRNVLIYFSKTTIRDIARRIWRTLADGGWLITASADPSLCEYGEFKIEMTPHGLVYRKASRDAIPMAKSTVWSDASFQAAQLTVAEQTDLESKFKPAPLPKNPISNRTVPEHGAKSSDSRTDRSSQNAKRPTRTSPTNDSVDLISNLAAAVAALEGGEPERAAELTARFGQDATACVIHTRALSAIDSTAALDFCQAACQRHPLKEELHYLSAVLFADANRYEEALRSLQKVIFLDRSSVMAHFLFGSLQRQLGQYKSARRHLQNVCELCAARKPNEVPPWSSGETLADLAMHAKSQLDCLH